ncbi:MAG TPA: poly-gamma-glutamate hydrolase family protein [Acidimicrobiales bacterium]
MDLAELLALPGVEEICVLRSTVGFLALHGGSQDRGTHEIASQAAEQSGASYYAIVQPPDLRVHLTSRRHDPAQSTNFSAFLDHVGIAISVHGFGRDSLTLTVDLARDVFIEPYGPARRGRQTAPLQGIILGGLNPALLDAARTVLSDRFPGFRVGGEQIRLGFHPENPVNLPVAHGVQIELPPVLRGIGEFGESLTPSRDGVVPQVIAALVELATRAGNLTDGDDAGAVAP